MATVNGGVVTLKCRFWVAMIITTVYEMPSCLEHSSNKPVNVLG